jgi:hypothetical protein
MKKNSLIFLLLFTSIVTVAQNQPDFIIKGNEAMKNLDYISATIWYEEGVVSVCDIHCIRQLTTIWLADSSMRNDMSNVMVQCFSCLEDNAIRKRDTTSIKYLITYYKEGIGTSKNVALADNWKQRLDEIRNPFQNPYGGQNGNRPPREKVKMQYFAGYSATIAAPFGLTVGAIGKSTGWYLRVRSNLTFPDYTSEYEVKDGAFTGGSSNYLPHYLNEYKSKTFIATGGIMIKAAPIFYISAGAGYCSREEFLLYEHISAIDSNPTNSFWVKSDSESTFQGLALDVDGTFRIGKAFCSFGCSVLNFKYITANAGIGIFF